nr:MAG TPA: hypothetical protein [Bacteriophage sp.]
MLQIMLHNHFVDISKMVVSRKKTKNTDRF